MRTPSRTYARVVPSIVAVGNMIATAATPTPTASVTDVAVIVELALTFTTPLPTFAAGMFEVAAVPARSPMIASTTPVISATAETPAPATMPTVIGEDV